MLLVAGSGFMRDFPMPINISSVDQDQQVAEAAVAALDKRAG
jgi:hypothetical protein